MSATLKAFNQLVNKLISFKELFGSFISSSDVTYSTLIWQLVNKLFISY